MSRIPQPSSGRTPYKQSPSKTTPAISTRSLVPPGYRSGPVSPSSPRSLVVPISRSRSTSPSSPTSPAASPKRLTRSIPKPPIRKSAHTEVEPPPPRPAVSIREAIALKRAEVQKAKASVAVNSSDEFVGLSEGISPGGQGTEEGDVFDLGRWTVKETIERSRSSGSINLSTRSLPCLPSAIFQIHLGLTPDPLPSVPNEPPLPDNPSNTRYKNGKEAPAWFEAQDLHVLKAWNNEIVEIQHEISLFGSLHTVDLHYNRLTSLPDAFGDLAELVYLDLSHNALTSLPANVFALPNLVTLNVSHNALTALPFRMPFSQDSPSRSRPSELHDGFFAPIIPRADVPLPKLQVLHASHNKISAEGIDHRQGDLPNSITKLDLSYNPLETETGVSGSSLIQALGQLENLKELLFEKAGISDKTFLADLLSLSPSSSPPFPRLRLLDCAETKVTASAIKAALAPLKKELTFDFTAEEPPEGMLRVLVGKKVIKEAWEIEAERQAQLKKSRRLNSQDYAPNSDTLADNVKKEVAKEPWEIEAEQGLLSEGAKRRARAAAAAAVVQQSTGSDTAPANGKPQEIAKEPWEIDAEQGLLSAGAQRRARALKAQNSSATSTPTIVIADSSGQEETSVSPSSSSTVSLSQSQFYKASTQTLTLPPSKPPSKALGHARAFSLAAPSWSAKSGALDKVELALPTPSLPLAEIAIQPFAQTLKVLILANRRMDPSFKLPSGSENVFLPHLEELSLEGCGLSDSVAVFRVDANGTATPSSRTNEPLLPLIAKMFPSLGTLDLSDNSLTSSSLTTEALSLLILAESESDDHGQNQRKGLRHLRLRGNRLDGLDGFRDLAESFKGNRTIPEWKLEELDVRENSITKLPPELGLLPLDVLLVDGNIFRIPQRRVWEREGTKGLLSWLRGRIE